jgi:hypothetical protein
MEKFLKFFNNFTEEGRGLFTAVCVFDGIKTELLGFELKFKVFSDEKL